jgi:ATP-binding cassette subfamily B protein/ATP-binding cassette subfamily C protein LapB
MKTAPKISQSTDPLLRCLELVFQHHRLKLDKALTRAALPIDWAQPLSADSAAAIARHAGLVVENAAIDTQAASELRAPAIVMTAGGALFALLPDAVGPPALKNPEGAATPLNTLENGGALSVLTFEKKILAPDAGALSFRRISAAQWFWAPMRGHRSDYVDILLATLFINLFAVAFPVFSMNVYDRVVPNNAQETLLALTAGIVLCFVVNFAFKAMRSKIIEAQAARIAAHLDAALMRHLLRIPDGASGLSVGEKSNLFREVQNLRDFFALKFLPALMDLPFFILFLLVIQAIAPGILTVVIGGVALMFVVTLAAQAPVDRTAHDNFAETQNKNTVLVETLNGSETIRQFNAFGEKLLSWGRLALRSADAAQKSQYMNTLAMDLCVTIMFLVNVFVIYEGVTEIKNGRLTMGGLVAASILVGRAMAPIMNIAMVTGNLKRSLDMIRTIDGVFKITGDPEREASYHSKAPFKGALEMRDVTFTYKGQARPSLQGASLSIAPGERVGILGKTGAGKSTVAKILAGSLAPLRGQVFVDGTAMELIHPDEWRGSIGVVSQDPFFFSGSIRDNILIGLGGHDVDEAWFREAVQIAGLDILLQQSGFGLDYQVGEGGKRLSGGQRQALAIARAIVRKPQVLFMDEPTNGMDSALEQAVRNRLDAFCKGRTLVLVTHRTTLVPLVGRLVIVDQGRIIADGPRDDIMRRLTGEPPNARS